MLIYMAQMVRAWILPSPFIVIYFCVFIGLGISVVDSSGKDGMEVPSFPRLAATSRFACGQLRGDQRVGGLGGCDRGLLGFNAPPLPGLLARRHEGIVGRQNRQAYALARPHQSMRTSRRQSRVSAGAVRMQTQIGAGVRYLTLQVCVCVCVRVCLCVCVSFASHLWWFV